MSEKKTKEERQNSAVANLMDEARKNMSPEERELATLRQSVQMLNGTTQMALRALHAITKRELEVAQINSAAGSLMVVYVENGRDLHPDVAKQLMVLMKMPIAILEKGTRLETISPDQLEAAGWTRLGPRGIVDAQGHAI